VLGGGNEANTEIGAIYIQIIRYPILGVHSRQRLVLLCQLFGVNVRDMMKLRTFLGILVVRNKPLDSRTRGSEVVRFPGRPL
jgi:hypothetical protein